MKNRDCLVQQIGIGFSLAQPLERSAEVVLGHRPRARHAVPRAVLQNKLPVLDRFFQCGAVAVFVAFSIKRIGPPGKVVPRLGRMPWGNQPRGLLIQFGCFPVVQFGHRQVAQRRGGRRGSDQLRLLGPLRLLDDFMCFLRRGYLHPRRFGKELPRLTEVANLYGGPPLTNKIQRLGIVPIERRSRRSLLLEGFELVCNLGQLL